MKIPFAWEVMDPQTLRAKVEGGWLVRFHSTTGAVSMTVVPDPKHQWELEVPAKVVEESRERLARLEVSLGDPYIDDIPKSEMRGEVDNLRRFLEQHP